MHVVLAVLSCTSSTGGLVPDQNSIELYELALNAMFHMQLEVHQQQVDHIHQVLETYKSSTHVKDSNIYINRDRKYKYATYSKK